MTAKERDEFRAKVRLAKTDRDREKSRKEWHELMRERAMSRRVPLYEE